jgi:hypothetical protein
VIPDQEAEAHGYLRIVDESTEWLLSPVHPSESVLGLGVVLATNHVGF